LIFTLAAAQAGIFVQNGQEYVYESSATASAGTMDHSPHLSGKNQVSEHSQG
jgi:hypothetical protein